MSGQCRTTLRRERYPCRGWGGGGGSTHRLVGLEGFLVGHGGQDGVATLRRQAEAGDGAPHSVPDNPLEGPGVEVLGLNTNNTHR